MLPLPQWQVCSNKGSVLFDNEDNDMRKLKLCVFPHYNKCVDSNGEWDRTWDESYVYVIYDEGIEVDGDGGFNSEKQARTAGEKRLKELEDKI